MSEWQPIDTFPYNTKWANAYHVMCAHDDKRWIRFGKYYGELKRWYYSGTNEISQWSQQEGDAPTHWMPIPDLPPFPKDSKDE